MKFSYLVIGGGMVGLATARYLLLADPGASVALVEAKARTCSGNSARSAALYRNLFSSPTSRLLAESSISYYLGFATELGLRPNGYLWCFSASQWAGVAAAAAGLVGQTRAASLLDAAAIGASLRLSDGSGDQAVSQAIFGGRCGSLSAQALGAHYERLFEAGGGIVQRGRSIARLELAPGSVQRFAAAVDTTGKRLEAERFVVATGCWLQDLLGPAGIASGVYPKKRQLFAFRLDDPGWLAAADPSGSERGRSGLPNIILPGGVYLNPIPERRLCVAGLADDLGRPFELPYAPVERAAAEPDYFRAAIEPELRRHFPGLAAQAEPLTIVTAWAGHYDYYWPDRNPVIERISNLVWVGGCSGSGIMKADAIGRLAAAKAVGQAQVSLAQAGPAGEDVAFSVDDLSLRQRRVERESLVI